MIDLQAEIQELQNHKRTKIEVMESCIQNRLNKSLKTYEKQLQQSLQYLLSRKESSLLKKL